MMSEEGSDQVRDPAGLRARRPLFDRGLLVCILVLQCAILVVLSHRYFTTAPEAVKTSATESHPRAGGPVLASPPGGQTGLAGDLPYRPPSRLSHEELTHFVNAFMQRPLFANERLFPPPPAWHGPNSRIEQVVEQAFHDFERLENLMDFDKGWPVLNPSPAMDMRDDEDHYLVAFSVPGLGSPELTVTLEGRLLTISGGSQARNRSQTIGFTKRVWLPGPVAHAGQAEARLTNGILRVMVPKADLMLEDAKPRRLL